MRGNNNSSKDKTDGYFTRNSDLRRSTGQMKDKRVDQLKQTQPPNLNLKDISNTSASHHHSDTSIEDGVQYPTSPSVHHLIKGFQNIIGNGNSKPAKAVTNIGYTKTSAKTSIVENTKSVKAISTIDTQATHITINDSNYKTPGFVVEASLPIDRNKRVSSKRKLSIRTKKAKNTSADDNTRYNIIQSLGMSAFEGNDNRNVEKSYSFFDIQSLFFDIQNAASLKSLYEEGSTYTKKLSGASAASQRNQNRKRLKSGEIDPETNKVLSRAESLVDEGDPKQNHLLLSCPYFRNEIAEPENSPDSNSQSAKYGKDISKLISMFNRNRSFKNLLSNSTKSSRRQHKSQTSEHDVLLEGVTDDSDFFTWDEPNVNEKQIFDFEHIDRGAMYYKQFFSKDEHFNLFGIDEKYGPMAISIARELLPKMAVLGHHNEVNEKTNKKYQYRVIFRTCELYTLRIAIMENSIPSISRHGGSRPLPLKDIIEYCFPDIQITCLRHCVPGPKIPTLLMKLDQQQLSTTYKVGLLYCKAKQRTEEEFYNNEHGGSEFLEFCSIIADTVTLKGFQGYRAQLDNQNDSTGQHSLYTIFHGREMMFHVSTKLPFTAHDRQQLLRKRHIGNDIVTVVFQETGSEPFTPEVMRSHFQHVFVVVRVKDPHTDHTKYEVAVTRCRDVPYFGPPIPPDHFDGNSAFREFLLSKLINAENAAHKSEKFTHMARRTRFEYLKDLATNHVGQQTLEVPSKFGFSFSSKKKEKTHPIVNPEIWLQGGLVWTVKFDFEHDGPGSSAFLSISTKAIVFVEQSTQKILVSIPCKHVLGWRTTSHTLKLFYDSGKMAFFTLVDDDINELPFVVNRLKAVTPGCETMDLTLRRNVDGQLGFHVFYEGLVAEVEPYGLSWQAGLRKGSRLLEISGHIVGNMTHERMILMLKRPGVVRIVVLPPAPDGQPRNYKAVRNLRRYSSMTSVYSMSVPNLAGGYSSSGMSSSKECVAAGSESPNDLTRVETAVVSHRPRSLSMEKMPRKDSSHSISDGSATISNKSEVEKSMVEISLNDNEPQNLLKENTKSQERLIMSRSATELPTVINKEKETPSPVPKQKITSPSPSVDLELGEIERALTDTRKSIDAKFFKSLANSSSPFFRPAKPPSLSSSEENELSDDNETVLSGLERESLNYGTTSSEFEHEFVRVNSPIKEWTVANKYDKENNHDKSSDDSKEGKNPPQPPPKTYQNITQKTNTTTKVSSSENKPLAKTEKVNRNVKSPPVPPKPAASSKPINSTVKTTQGKIVVGNQNVVDVKMPVDSSNTTTTQGISISKNSTVVNSGTKVIANKLESGRASPSKPGVATSSSSKPVITASLSRTGVVAVISSKPSTGSPSNSGVLTVSASTQGGILTVSASKEGVVTVSASNIGSHKKTDSYVSSITSIDDHGSYSDSSMHSQETLTSEKDSDTQRGNLVRTKVRDATEIINERNQYKGPKSKVQDVMKKANSFDNNGFNHTVEANRQHRPSLASHKSQESGRNTSPTRRINIRDKALINAVETAARQKVAGKDMSVSEPALKVGPTHEQPMRKYKSENQTKDVNHVTKPADNTAKFDESLNETFAKLDAAFGFRRQNGNPSRTDPPRDEKRKKKSKSSRRRSRNFEPPSSDSSADIDTDPKRRSRNLRRINLDDALNTKGPKSEAEESLEAAISDFRISLSDMQDDSKRDSIVKTTKDARNIDRDGISTSNRKTSSTSHVRDHGTPVSTTSKYQQQPQKLTYVKTVPVNTVQASSIKRPVSDGTAILNMSPNPDLRNSDNIDDPKGRGRSRSEAKISMRSRQCTSPTPKSETVSSNSENSSSINHYKKNTRRSSQPSPKESSASTSGGTIETVEETIIIESVILENEVIPPLPPLPLPISPSRGGIQTLPERSDKKKKATCTDQLGKGSVPCIPLVIRGLDLADASNVSSTDPWSEEDLDVMENELEQSVIRTRNAPQSHNGDGMFSKKCACMLHDNYTENVIIRKTSSVCRLSDYKHLIENNLIAPRAKYVCSACLNLRNRNVVQQNENNDKVVLSDENFDLDLIAVSRDLCKKLKGHDWTTLSASVKQELNNLADCLGQVINKSIYSDGNKISKDYKDIHFLKTLTPREWLKNRNGMLLSFLKGATGVSELNENVKKIRALTSSVELTYYARNLNIITPFAFRRSVVNYNLTHSKLAVRVNGSWEGSGSYKSVTEFLLEHLEPLKCPTDADVFNTIDNNQNMGKCRRRIVDGSKVPISICTTVGHIVTKPESFLQHNEAFSPRNWLNKLPLDTIITRIADLEEKGKNEFHSYRGIFISDMLAEVVHEHIVNSHQNGTRDYVDIAGFQNKRNNVCSKCSEVYDRNESKCPSCQFDADYHEFGYDPYHRTKSCHPSNEKPKMHVGEPCMVNPCSHESLESVISHLKETCDVGTKRKWIICQSDGLPYVLSSNIQDHFLHCKICNLLVEKKGLDKEDWQKFLSDHGKKCLSTIGIGKRFKSCFDNILLLPGPGHMEINEGRLLLKLLWKPLICHVSSLLGFRTPRAKEVIKEGIDHHRTRQILTVCLEAISKELLVPYVRYCITKHLEITPAGYEEWVCDVKNQSYLFFYHIAFSYLLSFNLLTEAVRKNNATRLMAARIQFAPLFYSFHHPKYQLLHLREMWQRVQMPEELLAYINSNESFSLSGKFNAGQGGDFVHEELNKRIKSLLPPGIPTSEVWRCICRKLTDLEELRDSAVKPAESRIRFKNHAHEVTMLRRELRMNMNLSHTSQSYSPLKSIDGDLLDPELVNLKYIATENFDEYKKKFFRTGTYGSKIYKPVFVTEEERNEFNKIENKTKQEIIDKTYELINSMPDKEIAQFRMIELKKNEKKFKHQQLVDFYYEINSEYDEQYAQLDDIEEANEVLEETDK